MADLLSYLAMPTEERGITFVNGELSAMPGLQPDLGHVLHDGDRVALFPPQEHVAFPVPPWCAHDQRNGRGHA